MTSQIVGFSSINENSNHSPLKGSFEELKRTLDEIHVPVVNPSPQEAIKLSDQYKIRLNETYCAALKGLTEGNESEKNQYLLLLSDIMTKFGRLRYEEEYPPCMVMMRGSLNVQLVAIGVLDKLSFEFSKDLFQLEATLFQHNQFSSFDDYLIKSDMKAVANLIQDKNLTPENLTKLGFTLSWLANSLHHTKGFRTQEKDASKEVITLNCQRFDQVYALCEKVLVMANNETANLELAEMYYNGLRGVEFRKDPKNIEGAHKWLDLAKKINPSLEMAARVANLKSRDWADFDLKRAREFLDEAIQIRASFPKEQQNPFLVANLNNRKAGFLLKEGQLEEADRVVDEAIAYSTACRGERDPVTDKLLDQTHNHQYFGIYDYQKAKIKLAKKEFSEALKFTERALEAYQYHHQDSEDLIAEAFQLKININLAMQQK